MTVPTKHSRAKFYVRDDRFLGIEYEAIYLFALGVTTLHTVQSFHLFSKQFNFTVSLGCLLVVFLHWGHAQLGLFVDHLQRRLLMGTTLFIMSGSFLLIAWNTQRPSALILTLLSTLVLTYPWLRDENVVERSTSREKDRYFIHDIINHTVGIKLFLSTRPKLSSQETKMLLREVDTMETMVMDHYQVEHKNLVRRRQWMYPYELEDGLEMTMKNFLAQRGVLTSFIFDPKLHDYQGLEIPVAPLFRIYSNLIKNAYDHGSPEVEVNIKLDEEKWGLNITIRSKLKRTLGGGENLESELSHIILQDDLGSSANVSGGLGLESVASLCEESGGEFHFHLSKGIWINEVFLPGRAGEQQDRPMSKQAA